MTYNYTSPVTCNADILGPNLAEICNVSAYYVFMSLLNAYLKTDQKISGSCERIRSVDTVDATYDYIVVGGGGAGAVVAARLSEDIDKRVLLLEAGPDEPIGAAVPSFWNTVIGSSLNWGYSTTNESTACLSSNGSCDCVAVKVLGGNTAINGMIYLRGNPSDYDHWAALGNKGWSWDDVLPYFIKSEDNEEIERVGTAYHGTGGPISVGRFPYQPPFGLSVLDAAEELGYGLSEDINGPNRTGFTITQAFNKHGVRSSSATAYLRPARNRENLHISLNSTVVRVIIENDTAVGVEYYKNGELKTVNASQEVIISAGSVKSAFILLHSGIGPKDHLESVGIEVVKDLPGVGENLHDHMAFSTTFTVDEPDDFDNNWAAAAEYLAFQTGPLASTGMSQVVGMFASNSLTPNSPDIQLFGTGYLAKCAPGEIDALSSTGKRTVGMATGWRNISSRGRVSLASNDPFDDPVIWGNYLSEQSDVDGVVTAIQYAIKLPEAEAMKAYNLTLTNTPLEACSNYTFLSTEYWACAVRQEAWPENHLSGSCKMGPESDSLAVVDPQLRVHGIKGLRVADASIIPKLPASNTAAPVMMIAERAAHFIKKSYYQELSAAEV